MQIIKTSKIIESLYFRNYIREAKTLLIPFVPILLHRRKRLTPENAKRVIIVKNADENPEPIADVVPTQTKKIRIKIISNQRNILTLGRKFREELLFHR